MIKPVIGIATVTVGLGATAVFSFAQSRFQVAPRSESQLQTLARQFTVQIDGQAPGSGVLVARQGQTYYILTAAHVVPSPDEYDIITADGQKHRLDFKQVRKITGADLALVPFNSPNSYTVATIGNSAEAKPNTSAFVTGFPSVPDGSSGSTYRFSDGKIAAQASRPLADGYALGYYNDTFAGMSGGPIFDQQGRLIGIHGASRTRFAATQGIDPTTGAKRGLNLGIPINTFLRQSAQIAPNLNLPVPPPQPVPAAPTASDYFIQGGQKDLEGNLKGALSDYNQAIRLQPDYVEAFFARGNANLDLGNHPAALQDFNQYIRARPTDPDGFNNRGIVKFNLKDLPGAITDYTQAVKLNPNYVLAYYNRGNAYSRSGQDQTAIADYTQALKLNPNYAAALRNRGNVRSSLGQNREAIADYDQAIRLDPKDGLTFAGRGAARSSLQDFQGALIDLNQAIKLNPQLFIAYTTRGLVNNALKNPQAAIADYEAAIRLNPKEPSVYLGRGFGRTQLKDFPGALADYNQALKLNPNFAQAYFSRALVRGQMGDLPGTRSDLQQAANLAQKQNNSSLYKSATELLRKLQ